MPAVIESTLYDSPGGALIPGSTQQNSRNDLQLGYQVTLRSVHVGTTYSWSLSFASDSPGSTVPGTPFDGTQSVSALLAPEGSTSRDAKFNVDFEGTYLIRLVVDAGLPTEDTQFIRARVLTLFGALKLIAAGERRDELGVIPVDATPEGWANDQNANFQRIGILLRRLSHSGRILFVDSNRGRDTAATQDDYNNVISIPGPEAARTEETGIKLRAMAHGDFSSINQAITYAQAAAARGEPPPSKTNPYFIVVRRGVYEEDLALASHIHIVGDDVPFVDVDEALEGTSSNHVEVRTVNTGGTGTHRYNPGGLHTVEEAFLFNLKLLGSGNTDQPVLDQQGGLLKLYGCLVDQQGDAVNQGEALRCEVANGANAPALWIDNSVIRSACTTADRVALRFDAINSYCQIKNSKVRAPQCQGISFNDSLYQTSELRLHADSEVIARDAFNGYGSLQEFADSEVVSTGAFPSIHINPFGLGAGSKAGNVTVRISHCSLQGEVSFETAGAVGATALYTNGIISQEAGGTHIVFPDAPGDLPDIWRPELDAETLRYLPDHANPLAGPGAAATINPLNQLPKTNVQEAIDVLVQALFPVAGSPFYSLHTAYSGLSTLSPPTLGGGLGRTITAGFGAVQIVGGTAPLGIDGEEKDGGLQVEGITDIGGLINGGVGDTLADIGHSEIMLNPDMIGAGPMIGLGRSGWSNDITGVDRGFGAAMLFADQADPFGAPASYNLHLRTANGRVSGTGKLGHIYMKSGTIWDSASADDPGDVHIVAGSTQVVAGTPGDLWLVPGIVSGGGFGAVWFTGEGHTSARLDAGGAYVGGVAGDVFIGTPTSIEKFTFTGAENFAAAIAVFNATARGFRAVDASTLVPPGAANTIALIQEYGPPGDIIYVGDSTGGTTNVALGDFRVAGGGATFTAGIWGDQIAVDVPVNGRLRVNGDLEVTGIIIGGGPGGGPALGAYVQVTNAMSPYATAAGVGIVGIDTSAGNVLVNLPQAVLEAGRILAVKHEVTGGGTATLAPFAGDTIEGETTHPFPGVGYGLLLYSDGGTDWRVLGEYVDPLARVANTAAAALTVNATDHYEIVGVNLVAGTNTVVTLAAGLSIGTRITIKDEDGLANAIPAPAGQLIRITDGGGGTIDGVANLDLTVAYASATLYKTAAGNWAII